jgi:arabinose-5-phosphate isomerase
MLDTAKRVFRVEAEAIVALSQRLDERFVAAVEMILSCKGRVVIAGFLSASGRGNSW